MAECADMSVSHLVSLLQVARGRSKGNFIVHNFCTDRGEARAESSRVEHDIFADVRRISSLSFSELLPPRHSEQLPGALLQSVSARESVCVCMSRAGEINSENFDETDFIDSPRLCFELLFALPHTITVFFSLET